MHHLDVDDLARRYQAGEPISQIAESLGVADAVVKRRLVANGCPIRTNSEAQRLRYGVTEVDDDAIVAAYRDGASCKAVATRFGISRPTIASILVRRGIPVRGRSEASFLRMARTSPERRREITQAAHAAVRGVPHSEEHRAKLARTRQARRFKISPVETELCEMLKAKGLDPIQQLAMGRYNVDVALEESSIAVEVFGGHWHASGAHAARYRERTDYILDRGWLPVMLWVTKAFPLTVAAADYLVTLHESRRLHEPVDRQEKVIRCDPHNGTVVECEPTSRPVVPSSVTT